MDSISGPLFSDDVPILKEGERIFGFVQSIQGVPMFLTGGARLEVRDANPGYLGFFEVESFDKTRFGPNTGVARALHPGSVIELSDETKAGVRYKANGSWTAPTRGPVEHNLLGSAIDIAGNHDIIDLCVPGYGPRASVAFAVEFLLNPSTHGDIGLYVPGSQSHWGQKSDIREEYSRYGLARQGIRESDTIRLKEAIPTAYISDGTVKNSGSTIRDQRLIISKKIEEFESITPPKYIVTSLLSRLTEETEDVIKRLTADGSTESVLRLWSPFTKRERDGPPQYGPQASEQRIGYEVHPTPETIEQVEKLDLPTKELAGPDRLNEYENLSSQSKEDGLPFPVTTTDLRGYLDGCSLTCEVLDAPDIRDALSDLLSEFQTFQDVDYYQAANLTFNTQMFFERLPVPVGYYDRWIQDRSFEGEIYLPKSSEEYIDDLESHDVDGEGGSLLRATKIAEQIADILRDDSPMFDRLVEMVEESSDSKGAIAIYNSSKKSGQILREALVEHSSVTDSDLGQSIYIVDSDSIRSIPPVDQLIFCGMQRPGQSCFYLHPRAENVTILSYSEWVQSAIQNHVDDASAALRSFIGVDESKLPTPEFEVPDDVREDSPDIATGGPAPSPQNESSESDTGAGTTGNSMRREDDRTQKDTNSGRSTSVPADLSEEDIQRLQDISELAPTKNGELADRWRFDSGSDLFQYVPSNLREYYERNDENLIVLSEEGREVLAKVE